MNRKNEKIASMALACLTAVGLLAAPFSSVAQANESAGISTAEEAEDGYARSAVGRNYLSLSSVSDKRVSAYERISVSVGGRRLAVDGFRANGTEYIHLKSASDAIGASYTYSFAAKSATVKAKGLTRAFRADYAREPIDLILSVKLICRQYRGVRSEK